MRMNIVNGARGIANMGRKFSWKIKRIITSANSVTIPAENLDDKLKNLPDCLVKKLAEVWFLASVVILTEFLIECFDQIIEKRYQKLFYNFTWNFDLAYNFS